MPVIEIHVMEGYGDDARSRLCTALTDAVLTVVPATPEAITVLVNEVVPSGYMRGGKARPPAPARQEPAALVKAFLGAMERRDLEAARSFLADGFTMQFPASPPMHTLDELIAWAAPRYRAIRKTYVGFDTAVASGRVVVYARGTLSGEWLDGSLFDGIRFIDRFELEGDKLIGQEVWNDLAETLRQGMTQ